MGLTRRRWLARLGGMAALYPMSRMADVSIDATLQQLAARETYPDEGAARGLRAMRYLNSAQAANWRGHKRFALGLVLVKSDVTKAAGATTALNAGAGRHSELVEGFEFYEQLSADATHYSMTLVQSSSGLAYETNQTGIIRVGTMQGGVFAGDYLRQPEPASNRSRSSKLGIIGGRVAEFFLPTLYASRGSSCCGLCGGHCVSVGAGECGATCSICCNLGFADCPWCCNVDCGCLGC